MSRPIDLSTCAELRLALGERALSTPLVIKAGDRVFTGAEISGSAGEFRIELRGAEEKAAEPEPVAAVVVPPPGVNPAVGGTTHYDPIASLPTPNGEPN